MTTTHARPNFTPSLDAMHHGLSTSDANRPLLELVLREAVACRRSIEKSGRHRCRWAIHGLCPEGSVFGIEHGGDAGLRVVQMDAYDLRLSFDQNGNELPRLVVDAAPTVPANIADRLEIDSGPIRLSQRERSTWTKPLKGTPGMGVTKMSWAKAVAAVTKRTNLEIAFSQNSKRI